MLEALRDLGLDRSGVTCVERVDAALTGQPPVAADRGALRRETAPVWEMVEAIIRGGQAYAPSFYVLLAVPSRPPLRSACRSRSRAGAKPRGSALQLLLNFVVLIVVGAGGLTAQRRIWHGRIPAARPVTAGKHNRSMAGS